MKRTSTLIIVFGVTYYLELRSAIYVYCTSHILPTLVVKICQIGCWDIVEH